MKKRNAVFLFLFTAIACLAMACFCACSNGADGINGVDGTNGSDGKSAYRIWLDEGHTGSQSDFLEWLKGEDGADGTGTDGKSAYEIWLDNGHTGTEADFLNWLKAEGSADGSGNGSSSDTWNIAASVSAKLTKNGEKYTLNISGSGNMQSWANAESVPWYSVGDKIEEINIGSEVTSIGNYAFSNTAVSSLIIPESVRSVGQYALPSQATAYTYAQTSVASEQNEGAVVSVYSANAPATHDRHWTSWGSTGNITDSPFEEELQYWHYGEDDEIVTWEKIKVLFIGNSFTFYYQMPVQFDAIAENLGYYVETYSIAVPGQTLETHANKTSNSGVQITALLNRVHDFDYVVLQEHSTRPYTEYNAFFNGVQSLKTQIEATQDDAKIYLYETWGYPGTLDNNTYEYIADMEQKLYEAYTNAATALQLNVTYVGSAYTLIRGETELYLYGGDDKHPGPLGSHLSACVHVASMLGGDVRNCTLTGDDITVIPSEGGSPQKLNLTEEQCEVLRAAAYSTVFEDVNQTYTVKLMYDGNVVDELTAKVGFGVTLPSCEVSGGEKFAGWTLPGADKIYASDIRISYSELSSHIEDGVVELNAKSYRTVIAVWGRWITEENFLSVLEGFKEYCEDNGYQYDKVGYIYYVGKETSDTYNPIANFTTKAKEDGVDILFPVGDDINTQANSQLKEIKDINKQKTVLVAGGKDRYVARLYDEGVNTLTDAFYNYLITDEAKAILNSLS